MEPVIFNKPNVDNNTSNSLQPNRWAVRSSSETVPLVPLAVAEGNDTDDDRQTVSGPQPGVDDGFFVINEKKPNGNGDVDDAEMIPTFNLPEAGDEIPEITPRAGPDGGSDPDDVDGTRRPLSPGENEKPLIPGRFPFSPGFGGSDTESIPDVNVYQHKKTLAQGMMDLALFSANANQLRYVLESSDKHPYFYPSIVLISISLMCQVLVGIGLIWNAIYNVKDEKQICVANKINNFTVIGIFLVTVVNVFISAFGVAGPVPAG